MAIAGLISYQAYLYFGQGTLSISANPKDATIMVDGTKFTINEAKNIPTRPGRHSIEIKIEGFNSIKQEVQSGWQEDIVKNFILKPKGMLDIYTTTDDHLDISEYKVIQEKFFYNNTWVAGYVVPNNTDEGDISVLVLKRTGSKWITVLHANTLPPDVAQQLPVDVYDYIKDFGNE